MITKIETSGARFLEATYALEIADVEKPEWDAIYTEAVTAKREYVRARAEQEENDKHDDRSESSRHDAEVDAAQDAEERNAATHD